MASDALLDLAYTSVVNNISRTETRLRWLDPGRRREVIARLREQIQTGTFRVLPADLSLTSRMSGGKLREIHVPAIEKRIGCWAVMEVVERYVHPLLIPNTACSVKGRGLHWLHNRIREDIRLSRAPYFYQSDIHHFFDSIDQSKLLAILPRYFDDPRVLAILESMATALPTGLAKGLRSSQCLSDIYLNDMHHLMWRECVRHERQVMYYNYCDDTSLLTFDKREAWRLRNIYVDALHDLGLEVNRSECVRPLSEGMDMLGYVYYPTHTLLRKSVKQDAARRLARVKSRRRRVQLFSALKGMALHADCKHLYRTLTHTDMKKFSEMGVVYTPADGKKRFPGKTFRLGSIQNKTIEVHDFETGVSTAHGEDRYLVSFRDSQTGEWGKFFTSSEEMKNILEQISDMEDGFPFETTIISEVFDGNKVKYKFS